MARPGPQHHMVMICEMHRYQSLWHRTDAITLHGLDIGDRRAIERAFGAKIQRKECANGLLEGGGAGGSVSIIEEEHMNVLNLLSQERLYTFSCEPKMKDIIAKPGMTDHRYLFVYAMQKAINYEDTDQEEKIK